jgi:outer membrane protein TolC
LSRSETTARPARAAPLRAATIAAALLAAAAAGGETLGEAWRAALAGDATLLAARERAAAAQARLLAARAARLPEVSLSASADRWRDTPAFDFTAAGIPAVLPLWSGETLTMTDARLTVPLYTAGMIGANVSAAEAAAAARDRSAAALEQDVKLAVAETYVAVLSAASALAVAQTNRSSLAAHADDVAVMQRTGQVPRNDLLAANVALADAQQRVLQAENALAVARAAYNRRVGRPLDAAVELSPDLPVAAEGGELAELAAAARANRAELAGLEAAAAALEASAAAQRAERRPQLEAHGGYTSFENDVLNREDFWSIGLGVRWRLFDGGRSRESAAALSAESRATERERADLATLIELQVQSAWLDRAATRARIAVAEGAVGQAEENLRVVRDRYRNGEGTNTEVLDAEGLRAQALDNLDNARYDAALAGFRLARATGTL